MDDKGRTISPFVGNHKHYLRFGNAGNDFDKFTIAFPEKLSNDADAFEYVTPHYEKRVAMYFDPNVGSRQANNTLVTTPRDSWTMGMNVHYNESETREAQFVVIKRGGASSLSITGKSCIVNCVLPPVPVIPLEEVTNLWSDPKTWKNLPNRIPLEGEDVIVPTDYNVIYDIGISPLFKSLEINGRVTFLPGQPAELNTYSIWVRAGELFAGNATHAHDGTVNITLHGNALTPSAFVFSPNIRTMNKNFIVTGTVKFYGKVRSTTTRLHSEVYPNQELFFVAPNLDWKKGDEIALTASNRNIVSYETATILDYLPGNG